MCAPAATGSFTTDDRHRIVEVRVRRTAGADVEESGGIVVHQLLLGPIGVATNEALRLNISAIGDEEHAPWDFVVRVVNTRGEVGVERRFTVAPGVTRSLEVDIGNPDIFPGETLGLRTLRAEIVGFNPQPDPPGFAATLETFNIRTGNAGIVLAETFVGDEEH